MCPPFQIFRVYSCMYLQLYLYFFFSTPISNNPASSIFSLLLHTIYIPPAHIQIWKLHWLRYFFCLPFPSVLSKWKHQPSTLSSACSSYIPIFHIFPESPHSLNWQYSTCHRWSLAFYFHHCHLWPSLLMLSVLLCQVRDITKTLSWLPSTESQQACFFHSSSNLFLNYIIHICWTSYQLWHLNLLIPLQQKSPIIHFTALGLHFFFFPPHICFFIMTLILLIRIFLQYLWRPSFWNCINCIPTYI